MPATLHHTACPLDCPDTCSLEVQVLDGRVTQIDGTRANPITGGYICRKVRHFPEHLYGEERLTTPLKRVGAKSRGEFEPISWDDAYGEIAERIQSSIQRHGGESILPFCYGGSNGLLTHDAVDARFFRRLGASQLARTVCAAATGRASDGLYGKMPGVAFDDYLHARLIVVWGANPSESGIHLVPFIRQAQKAGAKLVVIDPRKTPLAHRADIHLPLKVGTDLPIALAIIRHLFESGAADEAFLAQHATGADELRRRASAWPIERAAQVADIPAADLRAFAELYAATNPAVIRCGWGLERNKNGGSAVAAVLALPAVAGKFGRRGGGFTMSNSASWNLDATAAANEPARATRTINMNHLGRVLLEERSPPVEVLFVYNCNPLMTVPHQTAVRRGLLREDLFTVVFEQVMTDTARFADIVLPATTFLEHHDYRRGYGAYALLGCRPLIEPVGQSRPNYQVFAELCDRMGLSRDDDPRAPHELFDRVLGANGQAERIRGEMSASGVAAPDCGPHPVQFVDVFPRTADRKVHLVPPALDVEAGNGQPGGLYRYREDAANGESTKQPGRPSHELLTLISPATSRTITSYLGQLVKRQVPLELSPADAAARGIQDGDHVRASNEYGEVVCVAAIDADLRPGVAVLPKGLWSHNTLSGATANALAPDTLTDLGGGACFNDARVQVERMAGP